jgi:hypothetical protein
MGMLISVEGEQTVITPSEGTFSLEELQKYVKGFIEIAPIPEGRFAIFNEEGRLKQMRLNPVASQVAGQSLVGPVLVVNADEIE